MPCLPLAHISWALPDNALRPAVDAWLIDLFGAETAYEMLETPETAKYRLDREERLVVVGDTMLIPIAPAGEGAKAGNPLGDMLRRSSGPNRWIGLAVRTGNLGAAADWFRGRGFRLHFDPGMEDKYFLIPRRELLGMRLEVMQGELPNDPRLKPGWQAQRWAAQQALGIEGLLSVDLAAPDAATARACLGDKLGLPELGARDLPGEGACGLAFDLGDCVIEALVAQESDSLLARQAAEGHGMCGITFKVRSARAARDHLAGLGYGLTGSVDTRFAIQPEQAHGRLIWFSEVVPEGWSSPRSLLADPPSIPAT